jgi:hypothetical protein
MVVARFMRGWNERAAARGLAQPTDLTASPVPHDHLNGGDAGSPANSDASAAPHHRQSLERLVMTAHTVLRGPTSARFTAVCRRQSAKDTLATGKTQQEITAACKGVRPNHVGAAIARHKRAGRVEERDGKL